MFERGPASVPGYLLLLGEDHETRIAVTQLQAAIVASRDRLTPLLERMFETLNWRPQLVAASAMLVSKSSDQLPMLWSALRRPCWTSPQLAAVASRLDSNFHSNARACLEAGCRMDLRKASIMTPIGRHSALGPSSLDAHSAKLASALVALCSKHNADRTWLDDLTSRPDIAQMLASDVDEGGLIALDWRRGMDALLDDTPMQDGFR